MRSPYSKEQLSGMAVNPFQDGLLVDSYPHLAVILYEAGLTKTGESEDTLLRYTSLVCDQNSPMAKSHPDMRERKSQAAALTGYKSPDAKKNEATYSAHMKVIVLFMRKVVKSLDWRYICARLNRFEELEEVMYEIAKRGDDVKDTDLISYHQKKAMVSKEMKEIMDEIPALMTKFFGDDKQLQEMSVKIRTAETMADKKR